jgi:hypothetical protein
MSSQVDIFLESFQEEIEKAVRYLRERPWVNERAKHAEHKVQFMLTTSLVNRLNYVLTNGGREELDTSKSFKNFVDDVADAIALYITNVTIYLRQNDWTLLGTDEDKRNELEFQDSVMTNSLKIRKDLIALNVENKVMGLYLPLQGWDDEKNPLRLPFLLRHILDEKFPEIVKYSKQLNEE